MDERPPAAWTRWARLLVLAGLLVGAFVAVEATGVRDDPALARDLLVESGPLGVLAYLGAFVVGQLAQLPGIAFVLAARVAYGPWVGFVAAYAGALLAVSVSFFVVRAIGGRGMPIKWRWVQRALDRLERAPVATIALLRTVLVLSPPLSYALALSKTRFRDYFVGSAVGLVLPIAVWVAGSSCLLGAVGMS